MNHLVGSYPMDLHSDVLPAPITDLSASEYVTASLPACRLTELGPSLRTLLFTQYPRFIITRRSEWKQQREIPVVVR